MARVLSAHTGTPVVRLLGLSWLVDPSKNAATARATCRVALGMKTGPIENFSRVLSVLAVSG